MLTQFAGMAAAILVWVVAGTMLVGIGSVAVRAARLDRSVLQDPFTTALVGCCVWMPLAALAHFFVPLSLSVVGPIAGIFFMIGSIFLVRTGGEGLGLSPGFSVAFVLISVWLANQATALCDYVDSGAYQLAALKWTITHPLVPGLANLHFRLGFPSLYYDLVAAFEVWPRRGVASYFANSTLIWLLAYRGVRALQAARSAAARPAAHELFFVGLLPFVVVVVTSEMANNIMTDVPNYMLGLFGLAAVVRLRDEADRQRVGSWAAVAILLCVSATCTKLSGAGFAIGILLALGVFLWKYGIDFAWRPVLAAGLWAALSVSVLMARSYVISGYLAFPSAASAIGLRPDFAVPVRMTEWVKTDTYNYGRFVWPGYLARSLTKYPGPFRLMGQWMVDNLANGRWIATYFTTLPVLGFSTHVLPLLTAGVTVLYVWRRRHAAPFANTLEPTRWWPLSLPVLTGAVFCLVTAPDLRFGAHIGWAALAVTLAWSVERIGNRGWSRGLSLLVGLGALAVVALSFHVAMSAAIGTTRSRALYSVWVPPKVGGCPPAPVGMPVGEFRTDSGLTLQLSDHGWPGWGELLSIDYIEPNLALRDPKKLTAGFRLIKEPDVVPPPRYSELSKQVQPGPTP